MWPRVSRKKTAMLTNKKEHLALGHWTVRLNRAAPRFKKVRTAKMEHPFGTSYTWVVQFVLAGEVIHEELAIDRTHAIEIKNSYANWMKGKQQC